MRPTLYHFNQFVHSYITLFSLIHIRANIVKQAVSFFENCLNGAHYRKIFYVYVAQEVYQQSFPVCCTHLITFYGVRAALQFLLLPNQPTQACSQHSRWWRVAFTAKYFDSKSSGALQSSRGKPQGRPMLDIPYSTQIYSAILPFTPWVQIDIYLCARIRRYQKIISFRRLVWLRVNSEDYPHIYRSYTETD